MSVQVNNESKEIIIRLNRQFYDLDSIKQGINDFSALCSGSVKDADKIEIVLNVTSDANIGILGYEFCNYVFALMKNTNVV